MAITNIDIPLSYPSEEPGLKRAIERLANGVQSFIDQAPRNFEPRMLPLTTGETTLGYGVAVSVTLTSAESRLLFLPRPVSKDGGKTVGIYRTTTAGTITISATDALVDGVQSLTLASTVGLYVFYFDGANFYSICCAEQAAGGVASGAFAPADARYFVAGNHAALSSEMVPTNTTTAIWNVSNPGVFGVEIPTFTSALPGVVPASGGGTTNFLRADGAWTAPGGGGVASGAFAPADASYLTLQTHAALSNERVLGVGSGSTASGFGAAARFLGATDGGVGSNYSMFFDPTKRYVDVVDEFNGGMSNASAASPLVGDLGWVAGFARGSVARSVANPTGHPGAIVMRTGAATGQSLATIALGATGGSFDTKSIKEFEFIARIPTVTTRYIWESKMGDGAGGSFCGANSIGFEYVPTSTRIMFNVRSNSSNTYATGPAASGGAWVHLRAARIPSGGGWQFYVNDNLSQTIASDPTMRLSPVMYLKATDGTAKSTEVDRFRLSVNDLGVRYSNQ